MFYYDFDVEKTEYEEWFWDTYGEDVDDDYPNWERDTFGSYVEDCGLF